MNSAGASPRPAVAEAASCRPSREAVRHARAGLSGLIEAGDGAGHALVKTLGPVRALKIITGEERVGRAEAEAVGETLEAESTLIWRGLSAALERWRARLPHMNSERDLRRIRHLHGGLLIPEEVGWPPALAELGLAEPIALWFRGQVPSRDEHPWQPVPPQAHCVALVGARESTDYGARVVVELAAPLAQGHTLVSGGAEGIDALVHEAALANSRFTPPTIAVMAGGLGRLYPRSNHDLHRRIEAAGLLLAEVPPTAAPTRYRFLQRNRLIAALSACTVVIQARWRSGALNTANHAASLGRPVGAVPGSMLTPHAAGCHRLIQEGAACVTDAREVLALWHHTGPPLQLRAAEATRVLPQDGLEPEDLIVFDALPLGRGSTVEVLSQEVGASVSSTRACLGRLQLLGVAQQERQRWHKNPVGDVPRKPSR